MKHIQQLNHEEEKANYWKLIDPNEPLAKESSKAAISSIKAHVDSQIQQKDNKPRAFQECHKLTMKYLHGKFGKDMFDGGVFSADLKMAEN